MNTENGEIEIEDKGDQDSITPFDPSKIKMDTQTINLGYIIEMLENHEIDLQPDFQRASDLWDATKKSRLIESILLGLPLPSFYFNVEANKKWSVIDGLQRLCSIKDFIFPPNEEEQRNHKEKLKLVGLEFLTEYTGKTFDELEREDKRRISGHKITVNIIDKETPTKVKYIIFKRVNTAGIELTPQEMRHALNQGTAANFIAELAKLEEFKKATCYAIPEKRMEDRDFVTRFIAFYMLDYKTQYEGELDRFLNLAMEELSHSTEDTRKEIKTAFIRSMNLAYEIFGDDAFRKRFNDGDKRNPISKAVFDTISVNFAKLTKQERELLIQKKAEFKKRLIILFNTEIFKKSITTGTAQKKNIMTRFSEFRKTIDDPICTTDFQDATLSTNE